MDSKNNIIIALSGRENSGKTKTLNRVINKLEKTYKVSDIKVGYKDKLVTVNINGVIVGISTGGDTGCIVNCRISGLLEKNCSIIVTATRSRGQTKTEVNKFAEENNYKIHWIEKSVNCSDKNLNNKHNETDSEIVLQFILNYIK